MWWLSGMNSNRNNLTGEVLAYEALHGAGGAVVHLDPTPSGAGDIEYDEDDVEYFAGERNVLDGDQSENQDIESLSEESPVEVPQKNGPALWDPTEGKDSVNSAAAPKPVGAYPHARRVGDLLYLSGVGPRQPGTNAIPGGPIHDADGKPLNYDIKAQCRSVFDNVKVILEESGSSWDQLIDVTVFLVNMKRDFQVYNKIYAEYFKENLPCRTTVEINSLPTPIAIELKCIATIK